MSVKRARLYDLISFMTVLIVIIADQWTKFLVVQHLTEYVDVPLPVLGHYLSFDYIRNSGAAFSSFSGGSGSIILSVLIFAAIIIVGYMYARVINTGPFFYKFVFGLIIGGALGNLLDRVIHGGSVVDFIHFRIPEIGFNFAIFNVADACISVGVVLLFIFVLFGGLGRGDTSSSSTSNINSSDSLNSAASSGALPTTEQDAKQ